GIESELLIGVDRVEPFILELIGAQLVDEADAAALLREIEQHAAARARDLGDRAAQLVAAIAAQAAEQIAGEAFGMETHEHGLRRIGIADQNGEMLEPAIARAKRDDARVL